MITDKKSAKDVEGILIAYANPCMGNLEFYFRIYDEKDKRKFVDYEVRHNDLKIKIMEHAALVQQDDGDHYLDYDLPPRTKD